MDLNLKLLIVSARVRILLDTRSDRIRVWWEIGEVRVALRCGRSRWRVRRTWMTRIGTGARMGAARRTARR
jgi:hypothetical protein